MSTALPVAIDPPSADLAIHIDPPAVSATVVFRQVGDGPGQLFVRGPITAAGYRAAAGPRPQCAVARLRPGYGRAMLGPADAAGLVDRSVPLAEFWGNGADRLAAELAGLESGAVAVRLEEALLQRFSSSDGKAPYRELLDTAQHVLAWEPDRGGVSAVARDLSISERHLRTLFTTEIGLSPKLFARIARVRRAARAATAGVALAEVAREAGYYDQSHLTTDFRRVMGISPAAFVSGRRPTPHLCAAPPPAPDPSPEPTHPSGLRPA